MKVHDLSYQNYTNQAKIKLIARDKNLKNYPLFFSEIINDLFEELQAEYKKSDLYYIDKLPYLKIRLRNFEDIAPYKEEILELNKKLSEETANRSVMHVIRNKKRTYSNDNQEFEALTTLDPNDFEFIELVSSNKSNFSGKKIFKIRRKKNIKESR